ncbi:MAG TPA: chemotaxis protein CheB [Crinalium sp.]|jgi:two-component system chemotaxis response regulator CheB
MSFELVVIGSSLGGLRALELILPALPNYLPVAMAIAQHRHPYSNGSLLAFLQRHSALPVLEVEDKQPIETGHIYLAPADYHVLVEKGSFALSTEAPVAYARPSIDVLFETAADAYGKRVIGVILTGASSDGARGLAKIQKHGGFPIVQDPNTAENCLMPNAAIASVSTANVLPLRDIAPFLVHLCSSSETGVLGARC